MRKIRVLAIFAAVLVSCLKLSAQNTWVPGDDKYTLTLAFHNVDTVLVVVPDRYTLTEHNKEAIENYVFWEKVQKKPAYRYKKESQLNEQDYTRHLQFFGPFYAFSNRNVLDIPFRQHRNGFHYGEQLFEQPSDAFFYVNEDANRLYTCSNTDNWFQPYKEYAAGYYQCYVFRDNEIYLSGFHSDKGMPSQMNQMEKLRSSRFQTISTDYFDFEMPSSLVNDSVETLIRSEVDADIDTIFTGLQIEDKTIKRVKTYVYADADELKKFIAAPQWMTVYGKSFGTINHLSSFDLSTLKHETAHTIIGEKIGRCPNNFFNEGFAVYTSYFFAQNSYEKDLEQAKKNKEALTPELIFGEDIQFFDNMHNYPISGVFTKFLINKMGMKAFKASFAQNSFRQYFSNKGISADDLILEFKKTVLQADQSKPRSFDEQLDKWWYLETPIDRA